MYLPDINVWVALTFHAHRHHVSARAWFDNAPEDRIRYFCRDTQKGFLRISNSKSVFPHAALTKTQAWQQYDDYMLDPRIAYTFEPATVETIWRQLMRGKQYSPNVWNDAYLAAFAIAGGYELVTFDRGLKQFPGLNSTLLS